MDHDDGGGNSGNPSVPSNSLGPELDMTKTAAKAVHELKRLFLTPKLFWEEVEDDILGESYVINQEKYENIFSNVIKHIISPTARIESSKYWGVVPIEARELVELLLDSKKWKELFPTMINKVETFHSHSSNLQVIKEELHILSPLVPQREFFIVRCWEKIVEGLWIIADVSLSIVNNHQDDQFKVICYKRPSGCLIQAMSNASSKVKWIEHVEVDDKFKTHEMYRRLLCGNDSGLGYGAQRWIVTLERMCERMVFSSTLTIPASDSWGVITTYKEKRNLKNFGERMLKNFNEMLVMSNKEVDWPQNWNSGVRISTRMNNEFGSVYSVVISVPIPRTPFEVLKCLQNNYTRHQWHKLLPGNIFFEIARVSTGSSETNCVQLLMPTHKNHIFMPRDSNENTKLIIQESYMDELGGMLVFSLVDSSKMQSVISGQMDPSIIKVLPCGFTIASDNEDVDVGINVHRSATLLTMAFHGENIMTENEIEMTANNITTFIINNVTKTNYIPKSH